jgi:hypothetical protein
MTHKPDKWMLAIIAGYVLCFGIMLAIAFWPREEFCTAWSATETDAGTTWISLCNCEDCEPESMPWE